LKPQIKIHDSVKIGSWTALGETGFYWRRDDKGVLYTEPHEFGVRIDKDVWLGSHVSVDRGRWRDTVIQEGRKIDDHCHISHNVIIGKHCIIGPGVILLGSCEIGDYSYIWSGAIIHQGVKVGEGCTVGAATYLRHDTEDYSTVYGTGRNQELYSFNKNKTKKTEGGGGYKTNI